MQEKELKTRGRLALAGWALAAGAWAQTTAPIAPQTPTAPLPPPVEVPPPAEIPAEATEPLTVEEAVRIALLRSPDIDQAEAGIQAARGRTQAARSGLIPSLTLGAGYTRDSRGTGGGGGGGDNTGGGTTTGGTGGSTGFNTSLSVRQLLFDLGRTRNLVRQLDLLERAAGINLVRVRSNVALNVQQAFFEFAQSNQLVAVNEANLRNRQAQLDAAQARLKSGLGLPIDVVRARTQVAQAIFNLQSAQNNANIARTDLARTMGLDPRTPLTIENSTPGPGAELELPRLVETALDRRPEVRQAQTSLEAAEAGVRAARAINAPSVFLTLSSNARSDEFPPRHNSVALGARIQWTPFDTGQVSGRVNEARAQVETARAELEQNRLDVTAQVTQAYLNLRTSLSRVETALAEVANAEEGVRLAEGRYQAGVGQFLEVTDAQTALFQARTNLVNARIGVEQARAALNYAVGDPL